MKRKTIMMLVACSALAMSLCGCGNTKEEEVEEVEALTQTTELADYSSYVTLGQYTGFDIEVDAYEITDDMVDERKEQLVDYYNSTYVQDDDSEYEALKWGDELVKIITNGNYTKASKYEEYLKEQLTQNAEAEQESEYVNKLWDAVIADCTFGELPSDVIEENAENYYENQKAIYEYYATYYSYTYDEYMEEKQGMTDDEFHEKSYEYARTELERIYTAVTIFRDLGMELSDEDFSIAVKELTDKYGYDSSAEFVDKYGEDYVREVIVTNKVEDYLKTNNTMVISGE